MKQILTSLCLTVAVLLGSTGVSWGNEEVPLIKTLKEFYTLYHIADLCHGSEIITDTELNRMQNQLNKIFDAAFSEFNFSDEQKEKIKDTSWDASLEELNSSPEILFAKMLGLGSPVGWDKKIEWQEMCSYPIQQVNLFEQLVDQENGKRETKKREF